MARGGRLVSSIDLSSKVIGNTFPIDLRQAFVTVPMTGFDGTDPLGAPHLRVFNESGCGLTIVSDTGRQDVIAAGAWPIFELDPTEKLITCTVDYILPQAPVAKLYAVLYQPGEVVPEHVVLGNSPIGVSGNVSTSGSAGTSFVKNDGAAPATSIIEATPSDQGSSSVAINNDASGYEQVLSAGLLRKIRNVVRGNATTTKAAIDLGDAGDLSITTYHGGFDASCVFPGAQVSGTVANATNATNASSATNATTAAKVTPTTSLTTGDAWGFPVDSASGRALRHGVIFTGTGAGVYSHGMIGGTTPNFCAITPNQTNSTQTVGVDSLGSTTVHVNMPNAWPFLAFVCHL